MMDPFEQPINHKGFIYMSDPEKPNMLLCKEQSALDWEYSFPYERGSMTVVALNIAEMFKDICLRNDVRKIAQPEPPKLGPTRVATPQAMRIAILEILDKHIGRAYGTQQILEEINEIKITRKKK